MKRTKKRLFSIYIFWTIIWYLIFQFILKSHLNNTSIILSFLLISFTFLVKDYIDVAGKFKNWPFPKWWDHAPLSVMITIFYYNVYTPLILFSLIDAVIDIWDDFKKVS
ncbi:MAG TPA: hypothetical protein QGG70_00050 [Candidatus Pacearchaeota archaeon]|jgi:hypothetical protein|nr:hypothetical protein [Candidatus Pacearchaeota archaeon]|tara:strand:+ start:1917 stop:2243 length:327 start_codon:yes stop_codon:yes gene_type:complete